MSGITSIPGQNYGFDASNNTQVIPLGGTATVILVAGGELTMSIDDTSVAELVGGKTTNPNDPKLPNLSEWEKTQTLERITLRGKGAGSTVLRAKLPDGRNWIDPLRIVVRPDKTTFRQVDGKTTVGEGIAQDVKGKTLHEIVVRIAQDQLNSEERKPQDGSAYGASGGEDWCGVFAWWCWQQAAKLKGGSNPFGGMDHLKSPQKAINWALANASFRVFNVKLATAIAGYPKAASSTITPVSPSAATPVLPGDIMIERHQTATYVDKQGVTQKRDFFTQWKHVALVTSKITSASGTFTTIEGNQGNVESIKAYTHDLSDALSYDVGDPKSRFAFVAYVE